MKKDEKNSGKFIWNKLLIALAVISSSFALFIIILLHANKTEKETLIMSTDEMELNYAITEETSNTWDVSENGDESVIATLDDNGVLTISGNGKMKSYNSSSNRPWHSIEEQIKSVKIENGVTSIGSYAFSNCTRLESIEIPGSVTSIGNYVFNGCVSLTKIEVDENNTSYMDDNGVLYTKNKKKIIRYPEGKIGTEYQILSGVEIIDDYAFYKCSSLGSIKIPEGVTSIGSYAFSNCTRLENIEIPGSVTSIGRAAFNYCTSLTSIEIPGSVMSIGDSAFSSCTNLTKIEVDEDNTSYMDDNGVLYTKDKKEIIKYPKGKTETEYQILSGVEIIGIGAFSSCSSLEIIKIPEGVTRIEDFAFSSCESLESLEIPEGVESVGDNAFSHCSSLESIKIPEGVTSIGIGAFYCCTSLTNIEIPESVTSIGNTAFYGCRIINLINIEYIEIELPNILKRTQDESDILYSNKEFTLKNCTIEDGKVKINEGVTYGTIYVNDGKLQGLMYVISYNSWDVSENGDGSVIATLDDNGVLTISGNGKMKDYNSSSNRPWNSITSEIKSVKIEEGITSIGSNAFSSCGSLESIEIPGSVISIKNDAFWYCTNLTSIEIPGSVTCIEDSAFSYCRSLTKIEVDDNNTSYMDDNGVLYTKDKKKIIRYPGGKTEIEYQISSGVEIVGNYAFSSCSSLESIKIPEGVTSIGRHAFGLCKSLTNIEIPRSVTSIGSYAFSNCTRLESIEIPGSVTSIEDSAFSYCTSLTIIEIPESVTSIGVCSFEYCTRLESIEIPSSVTNIESLAFRSCTSLTRIEVDENNTSYMDENGVLYTKDKKNIIKYPEGKKETEYQILSGVEIIGYCAFSNCSSLESIKIPEGITNIDSYAFHDCTNLTSIKIPKSVTKIGNNAFEDCNYLTILCYKGSYAETYAIENNISYEIITLEKIAVTTAPKKTSYVEEESFDKTGMVVTATYSDESAEEITNYEITDGSNLTAGKTSITISYTEGEITRTTTQNIVVVEKLYVNINTYEERQEGKMKYIKKVQPSTTIEEFLKKIETNGNKEIYKGTGKITNTATEIATGMKLKISLGTQQVEYIIVIIGDSNGDGQADFKDILAINKHRLNKAKLEGEYLLAGDVNEDGQVSFKDILQINKFRLGKIEKL